MGDEVVIFIFPSSYAILTFETEEEAKRVLQASKGLVVGNSHVLVMYAYTKDEPKDELDDSELPPPPKKLKVRSFSYGINIEVP